MIDSARIVEIADAQSGARAKIHVGLGFNCFSFQVDDSGQPLELLWAAPDFAVGTARASGSGIPILFPFPGRLRGTRLAWGGRVFDLAAGDGRGNAIHGFVHERPWRVVRQEDNLVQAEFQASLDAPELLSQWPADFLISIKYSLSGGGQSAAELHCRIDITNPDDKPLPCGLGLHPYFRLPLSSDLSSDAALSNEEDRAGLADECEMRLPAGERLELENMLPSGQRRTLDSAENYAGGVPFAKLHLDDIFSRLDYRNRNCQASLTDPNSQRALEIRFDDSFPFCVVYNPPHREAICIEPYSMVPGDFESPDSDGGAWVLARGQKKTATMTLSARS